MRNYLVILIVLCCPLFMLGQDLEVAGKAKIVTMDTVNTVVNIVVRLADGTLAIREVSTLPPDADSDPTNEKISIMMIIGDSLLLTEGAITMKLAVDSSNSNEIQTLSSVLVQDNDGGASRIKNIADPVEAQDAITKAYMDQKFNNLLTSLANELELNIQQRLNIGETPLHIFNDSTSIDSLYGKSYQGGILFYLDTLNMHSFEGLIAAPFDQDSLGSFNRSWGCVDIDLPNVPNVPDIGGIPAGPGSEIGDGPMNTDSIIVNGCILSGHAARICADLVLEGYDDWFLPSILEADQMYKNLHLSGLGGFALDFYWSSTEADFSKSWAKYFFNDFQKDTAKANLYYVRAVRTF